MVGAALNDLFEYTEYHFACEERLMKASKYPAHQLEEHLAMHRKFISKMKEEKEAFFTKNTKIVGDSLLEYIKTWIIEHIKKKDKEVCAYFVFDPILGMQIYCKKETKVFYQLKIFYSNKAIIYICVF